MTQMKSDIPVRRTWQATKKKYSIKDGAVSGISVGDELDRWHKVTAMAQMPAAIERLEQKLNAFITKFDKKSIKQYPAFQKEFLDVYLGQAHELGKDLKRYNADVGLYKTELTKFFSAVTKLDRATSEKKLLDAFVSGPLRGLSAMGSKVQSIDTTIINKALSRMQKAVAGLGPAPSRQDLAAVVDSVDALVKIVDEAATKQGLAAAAK